MITKFIEKSNKIHDFKYDYSLVVYKNAKTKVSIICPIHGLFEQTSSTHISIGCGCPKCIDKHYSKKSISWLHFVSKSEGINIQHAENGGEYFILGTKYRADGYCQETNTIYEFHGDKFHGNPIIFNANDRCHPFDSSITAGELYHQTCIKETTIRELGYNLVVMWENNFK